MNLIKTKRINTGIYSTEGELIKFTTSYSTGGERFISKIKEGYIVFELQKSYESTLWLGEVRIYSDSELTNLIYSESGDHYADSKKELLYGFTLMLRNEVIDFYRI